MPDIEGLIATVLNLLDDAVDAAETRLPRNDQTDPIIRFAIYLFARKHLAEHAREIVWLEEPFPEVGDAEARVS